MNNLDAILGKRISAYKVIKSENKQLDGYNQAILLKLEDDVLVEISAELETAHYETVGEYIEITVTSPDNEGWVRARRA